MRQVLRVFVAKKPANTIFLIILFGARSHRAGILKELLREKIIHDMNASFLPSGGLVLDGIIKTKKDRGRSIGHVLEKLRP